MTPIAPIPPVEELGKLAAPMASALPQGASPELAQKFQALMQRNDAHEAAAGIDARSGGMNAVTGILEHQQAEISQVQNSMQDFIEKAPSLSPTDRFVAGAAMMQKESLVHMKMSLAMGVTKSSNKSLQTLLKNE